MWSEQAFILKGTYFTVTRQVQVPWVLPGIYWILWEIDTAGSVPEWNESDNTVHSKMFLNVLNC